MTEKEIIIGCIKNNRECQRAFVDTYSKYMFGVCRRYFHDTNLAKDCLQDALVKVLTNINQFQEQNFKAWIAKITVRECLQTIRKNKKHIFFEIGSISEPFRNENVSFQMEQMDILAFLDLLPDACRIAINMYIIEGYSHEEIAETLGIAIGTSRSLVSRGRQKIKNHFELEQLRVIHRNKKKQISKYKNR